MRKNLGEDINVRFNLKYVLCDSINHKRTAHIQRQYFSSQHSLCFNNKVVGVIPVRQQVSGIFIIHTYVVIIERAGKKVIYLPGNVKDIAHPREEGHS